MNGKGDKFRQSVIKPFNMASYWCQNDKHKDYGKPSKKCQECKNKK